LQATITEDETTVTAEMAGAPFVKVSCNVNRSLEETFAYVVNVANREKLLTVEKNKSCSYTTFGFAASAQKNLVDRIVGLWNFSDNGNGTTAIEWTYTLVPTDEHARTVIENQLLAHYRGRLESAINIIKEDLEN